MLTVLVILSTNGLTCTSRQHVCTEYPNEYYRPPAAQTRIQDYSNGGYGADPAPPPTSAPAKKPDFWLLAFPNGTIVLAVAYWTDHDTLHYVTRTKEQKQIPILAIDRDLTDQLNQERGLEFRIPK